MADIDIPRDERQFTAALIVALDTAAHGLKLTAREREILDRALRMPDIVFLMTEEEREAARAALAGGIANRVQSEDQKTDVNRARREALGQAVRSIRMAHLGKCGLRLSWGEMTQRREPVDA